MDYFALLDLPRQPWLDAETVKASFQRLAARAHPDAGGDASRFAELNTAWQTLRDPVARLRHFLELEQPAALSLSRETPQELGDLFMEIAGLRQSTQRFAARRQAAGSPLTRALLEPERLALETRLLDLSAQVEEKLRALQTSLQQGPVSPPDLARWLNALTYLTKWEAELRELRTSSQGNSL